MANPQPTDAHLRVAHSINEAIMLRDFSKRQRKILDLILRLSWGCGKKIAIIPNQRDFEVVGIREGHVKDGINWLIESKVITRDGDQYRFNKNFDEWQVSRVKPFQPEKLTKLVSLNIKDAIKEAYQNSKQELPKTGSGNLPKQEETAYKNSKFPKRDLASGKETLNKGIKKDIERDDSDYETITIWEPDPKAKEIWNKALEKLKDQVTKPNFRTWLSNTQAISYKGNVFIIGTPNADIAEYLDQNWRSLIERTLVELTQARVKIILFKVIKGN